MMEKNLLNEELIIVMPVYNENEVILEVFSELRKNRSDKIVLVDDGSDKKIESELGENVFILRHAINRGKGAAVKTGIEAAKKMGASIVVTMDADGQHDPRDITKMEKLIKNGYDVVLGSRFKNQEDILNMPWAKRCLNHLGNFFTWLVYGIYVSDSQSGFRAYSRKAIRLIDTRTDRYEYDSEIIREIARNKLPYIETPIKVRYTKYSMEKKNKQNLKNGVKTLFKMILSE